MAPQSSGLLGKSINGMNGVGKINKEEITSGLILQQSGSHQHRPIDHYTQPTGEFSAGTSAAGEACPLPARQAMDEHARYCKINKNSDLDIFASSGGDDDVHVDPILESNREFYPDEFLPAEHATDTQLTFEL